MSCLKPFPIFLDIDNKRVLSDIEPYHSKYFLPFGAVKAMDAGCYTCSLCRKRRLDDWFIRCICEARYHKKICFLTLTYADETLPKDHKLSYEDVCKFFKRLRKNSGVKIRYFLCGEYGSKKGRPHYHAVIFGLDETDADVIRKSWKKGFIHVGSFSARALRYTMKYFLKTVVRPSRQKHYDEKFFCLSSRNPGLGYQYLEDNYEKLASQGYILYHGRKHWLPRYFISKIKSSDLNVTAYLDFAKERWFKYTDELCEKFSIPVNPYRYEVVTSRVVTSRPFSEDAFYIDYSWFVDPTTGSLLGATEYGEYLSVLEDFFRDQAVYRDTEYNAAAKLKRKF